MSQEKHVAIECLRNQSYLQRINSGYSMGRDGKARRPRAIQGRCDRTKEVGGRNSELTKGAAQWHDYFFYCYLRRASSSPCGYIRFRLIYL